MNPTASVDLEELSQKGATDTTPCAKCNKTTRSHLICRIDGVWQDLPEENPFGDEGGAGTLLLAVVCHTCYGEIDSEWMPEEGHESAFSVVISG